MKNFDTHLVFISITKPKISTKPQNADFDFGGLANYICGPAKSLGGGGEVSESMDRQGCAILALEVVPKNLIFR